MTIKGTLKYGLRVGDDVHKDFEMRAASVGDMFDAEEIASVSTPFKYRAALMGIQLVRLGTLSGPIDVKVLRGMDPDDLDILSKAQLDADKEGKGEPSS